MEDTSVLDVVHFLEKRGVEKKYLNCIIEQKIDPQTLLAMSDDQLHAYIPAYGDIHAAKRYFEDQNKKDQKNKRTETLFQRLRRKLGQKDKSSDSEEEQKTTPEKKLQKKSKHGKTSRSTMNKMSRSEKLRGNENAIKGSRKIEIGWFDYDYSDNMFRQVKKPKGGGAREVVVPKSWIPPDIIEQGKRIFFLDGKSKKGHVSEFKFELRNFMGEPMEEDCTVGQLYETTCSRILRYYIYTKKISTCTAVQEVEANHDMSDDSLPDPKLFSCRPSSSQNKQSRKTLSDTDKCINSPTSHADPTLSASAIPSACSEIIPSYVNIPTTSNTSTVLTIKMKDDDGTIYCPKESDNYLLTESLNPGTQIFASENLSVLSSGANDETLPLDNPILQQVLLTDLSMCSEASTNIYNYVIIPDELSTSGPDEFSTLRPDELSILPRKVIRIHKSRTFSEMIDLFRDENMDFDEKVTKVVRVMPNGQDEKGEGIGFVKDVFCEFWESFYTKCCEGVNTKVPILRHDMQENEWKSVAAILCNGYKTVGYFPIQICQAVIEDAMFGVSTTDLINCFMEYIPDNDKRVIQTALDNFDEEKTSDLIDSLDCYDCRKYPTKENIKKIIEEIASKEILQKPKFVTDCWKTVFVDKLQMDSETISRVYREKFPTVGKILKSLSFPSSLDLKEQLTAGYLKKFIKSLNDRDVQNFLRFCTGANLSCDTIKVEFTRLTGFQRRPTSMTCGNILFLPSSYESVAELREEFTFIFNGYYWEMDYV